MSTKIRLKRIGSKGRPFYRVVVVDSRAPQDGRVIEVVGIYQPLAEPAAFEVDQDKVKGWLAKGAIPSDIVRKYLGKTGILPAADFSQKPKRISRAEEKKQKEEVVKAKEAAAAAKKEKVVADKKAVDEKTAADKKATEEKQTAAQ